MEYLPINRKRFYIDTLIAGCIVIFVLLAYATGKAQAIATNLVTNGEIDEAAGF